MTPTITRTPERVVPVAEQRVAHVLAILRRLLAVDAVIAGFLGTLAIWSCLPDILSQPNMPLLLTGVALWLLAGLMTVLWRGIERDDARVITWSVGLLTVALPLGITAIALGLVGFLASVLTLNCGLFVPSFILATVGWAHVKGPATVWPMRHTIEEHMWERIASRTRVGLNWVE